MKNRGFTLTEIIGVVIILGMLVLIAFPPLLNVIRGTNEEITNANKTLLLSAADQYTDTYKNNFPKNEGSIYCISYGDLIKEELIPSNIPNKDGQTLDYNTKIKVSVNNDKYEYSIDNNCKAKSSLLADVLKEQYSESNAVGLLKDETGYYYKGTNEEVTNNFVWFAGHLWRVISIDQNNNLTMITHQPIVNIQPTNNDSIWDTKEKYESSYINQWLNEVFLGSMEEIDKNKLLTNTFNIGIYDNVKEITTVQKAGLLDKDQYTKAGLANSYLDIKDGFWLGNRRNANDSVYIVSVNSAGNFEDKSAAYSLDVRPVIKISNLTFTNGDGTLANPYREKSATTNTSNIKVGEYVSVPGGSEYCKREGHVGQCLFRVVSKDNDSIKVVLNGLLPNTSAFGSDVTYTSGNTVDTVLTTFANTISSNYRYTENKVFNIGKYTSATNYTSVGNTTYVGNVGLPIVGEMFTGNDIDVSTTAKIFVNINTIENPISVYAFWTMNAYDTQYMVYLGDSYGLEPHGPGNHNPTYSYGVRPVLFLKNNLNFTSGEGTAENPFTLE